MYVQGWHGQVFEQPNFSGSAEKYGNLSPAISERLTFAHSPFTRSLNQAGSLPTISHSHSDVNRAPWLVVHLRLEVFELRHGPLFCHTPRQLAVEHTLKRDVRIVRIPTTRSSPSHTFKRRLALLMELLSLKNTSGHWERSGRVKVDFAKQVPQGSECHGHQMGKVNKEVDARQDCSHLNKLGTSTRNGLSDNFAVESSATSGQLSPMESKDMRVHIHPAGKSILCSAMSLMPLAYGTNNFRSIPDISSGLVG